MKPEHFVYWLQGMLEDGKHKTLDEQQVKLIREHLALVFKKETGACEQKADEPAPSVLDLDFQKLLEEAERNRNRHPRFRRPLVWPPEWERSDLIC